MSVMKAAILVGMVFIAACYGAVSRLSSGQDYERRAIKMNILLKILKEIKEINHEIEQEINNLFKEIPLECDVSLPQKTSLVCQAKRTIEVDVMKFIWKLNATGSHGFALLDVPSPRTLILRDFANPFTRIYLEGYFQTVLATSLGPLIIKRFVNEISDKNKYTILSEFFKISAEVGGVYSRRASKYEAFIDNKAEWIEDKFFTQQRLAGVNPMSLRRVTLKTGSVGLDWDTLNETLNPNFPWEDAVRGALRTNDTLEEAINQRRVYVLRYELCDDLPREKDLTDKDSSRTMWNTLSPIALFASAENSQTNTNRLVPVAIQMDYTPDSAVYTPEDDGKWKLAKLNVQVTDLGYSQIVEHLAKVHFLMEPFCVILKRTLSSAHPLHQMLKYHCRDVTVPNTIGAPNLLAEGQIVDKLFAFGNKGAIRLLTKAHPLTTWDVTDFKNEIRKRGVDNKTVLPYYPYRDDGEQILKIIELIVKNYVNLYYNNDEDVKNDHEFQRYLHELSIDSPSICDGGYGKIRGLPSKIDTKEELSDFVTRIISQLSIQHAAVNYPLTDYAEYTPNLPTKLYNDTKLKEGEYSDLRLPNLNTSAIEAAVHNGLGLFRFDTLFDYGNELRDPKAVKLINVWYSYLMSVVQPAMQEKNRKRKEDGFLTYPYFIPRWLPNGIQT